jgi:hypothetical protein
MFLWVAASNEFDGLEFAYLAGYPGRRSRATESSSRALAEPLPLFILCPVMPH